MSIVVRAYDRKSLRAGVPPFCQLCRSAGIPVPDTEVQFHPGRRWRFDYAWPESMVALEVEGGVWSGGRHTRGKGFLGDIEKYNAAASLGWRVFRVVPDALLTDATLAMVRSPLMAKGGS